MRASERAEVACCQRPQARSSFVPSATGFDLGLYQRGAGQKLLLPPPLFTQLCVYSRKPDSSSPPGCSLGSPASRGVRSGVEGRGPRPEMPGTDALTGLVRTEGTGRGSDSPTSRPGLLWRQTLPSASRTLSSPRASSRFAPTLWSGHPPAVSQPLGHKSPVTLTLAAPCLRVTSWGLVVCQGCRNRVPQTTRLR